MVVCSQSNSIQSEVKRFIAFEKLHLSHTCCSLTWLDNKVEAELTVRSDIDGSREEQEELLAQLETMLLEPGSDWWSFAIDT